VASESSENTKVVRTLNWLLRGEISATQTYGLAIPRVTDDRPQDVEILRTIARDHDVAVQQIRAAIERVGGTPDEGSGAWPGVVKTVAGPGKVFGQAAALQALKEAEESSLNDYRKALKQVTDEAGSIIRDNIIPARMKHIDDLAALISRL
jgi:hypothetical protein